MNDIEKVFIEDITFKPLNFEETEILLGEDNQEKIIPLKIASCKISNQQILPPELNIKDKITKIEIESSWSLKIIALTIGGWLPAGITPSDSQYLLDKNVFNKKIFLSYFIKFISISSHSSQLGLHFIIPSFFLIYS